MAAELVYEVSRYDVSTDAETLIERFQLHRDRGALQRRGGDGTETAVDGDDPATVIAADAQLSEVRADQITRVTAVSEIEAVLPLVLTARSPQPGRFRVLYVNGSRWALFPGQGGASHLLPQDWPTVAQGQSWLRLSFIETGSMVSGHDVTELGLATPVVAVDAGQLDPLVDNGEPAVRVWRRGATPADDAQIVVSWLHGNALSDYLGIDTDMLVQLFIEAAVQAPRDRRQICDGEFLAAVTGTSDWAGTTPRSEWGLTVNLAPEAVEAALDAIAESGPHWRYAIVAARDPESPAGQVRRTLLAEIGR